jgi:hypothetical protein
MTGIASPSVGTSAPSRAVIAAGALVNLLALLSIFEPEAVPAPLVRAAVYGFAALVTFRLVYPVADPRLLAPVYLLCLVGLTFYSVAPLVYKLLNDPVFPDLHDRLMSYPGSRGEMIQLQFAAIGFLIAAGIPSPRSRLDDIDAAVLPQRRAAALRLMLGLALLLCLLKFADSRLYPLATVLPGALGGEIRNVLTPAIFFLLSASLVLAVADRRVVKAAVLAWLVCLVLLLASDLARLPMSLTAFALLAILAFGAVRFGRIVWICLVAVPVLMLVVAGANSFRHHYRMGSTEAVGPQFEKSLYGKLLVRQGMSAWCFDRAVDRNWNKAEDRRYLALLSGLVPRALWPDKPSLSRGTEYFIDYCEGRVDRNNPHSEALTLPAEMIMEGGWPGLLVGEAVLFALLGAASFVMFRLGPALLATGIAMLPWLSSAEQHATFYFAHCVKVFLIMLPLALAFHFYAVRRGGGAG